MAGHRRPMVQAPTGAGKTVLASAIVEGALAKGNRVLFVVPFLDLIDQTFARFAEQGITCTAAIQGQHPATDASQPVQIASIQTLQRRKLPQADVVVVDEAHRLYRFFGEWMALPEWQKVPFIGLSATPWTKGLGRYYDDLIVAATTAELIDKGFLSPFKVYAPAHPDLSKVKTVAGDYHEGQLAEVMSQPVLVADIVSTWLRLGEDRPTLCFAVDKAHARRIADEFEATGVPSACVVAETPTDERERIKQRLADGRIKVIVNVATMTTGVDLDVRCIILARPTKSEILFTQIVGRGLRTAPGKSECLILDHSDSTLRLGFVSDIHHEVLDDGRPQQSTSHAKAKAEKLPKECPSCSYLKPAGVHQCPACGFAPERQSIIEEKSGELVQINGKRKSAVHQHDKQTFYSMLLYVQEERGYKDTYAGARFKSRFNEWPRGLREVPVPPDAAMLNWLKSQQIAFHKRKQKEARRAA